MLRPRGAQGLASLPPHAEVIIAITVWATKMECAATAERVAPPADSVADLVRHGIGATFATPYTGRLRFAAYTLLPRLLLPVKRIRTLGA